LNKVMSPRRAGDAASVISNNAKLRSLLRWQPKYDDLDVIVASAYRWEMKGHNGS
jgi:UDP-glucose 4-epimerase